MNSNSRWMAQVDAKNISTYILYLTFVFLDKLHLLSFLMLRAVLLVLCILHAHHFSLHVCVCVHRYKHIELSYLTSTLASGSTSPLYYYWTSIKEAKHLFNLDANLVVLYPPALCILHIYWEGAPFGAFLFILLLHLSKRIACPFNI